jgi:hypothetical protein
MENNASASARTSVSASQESPQCHSGNLMAVVDHADSVETASASLPTDATVAGIEEGHVEFIADNINDSSDDPICTDFSLSCQTAAALDAIMILNSSLSPFQSRLITVSVNPQNAKTGPQILAHR